MDKFTCTALSTILAMATACGSASGASHASTADNDNTLFVIPPIPHSSDSNASTAASGPQVDNFTIGDAISFQYNRNDGVAGVTARIIINSTAKACADTNANTLHVGESQVVIDLRDVPDGQIAANTYVYPATANTPFQLAAATFAKVESPCYYDSADMLVSGTVQLISVQAGNSLAGSYMLQFASGTVSGKFTAANCQAVNATPSTAPVCN